MGNFNCLLPFFFILLCCFIGAISINLEITSRPPSLNPSLPPLNPQLLNFTDQRLALVYPIINTFKNTITLDPLGVTNSWVGPDICSYKGFYCDSPPDNETATALASIDFNGFQLRAPTLDGFLDQLPDLALFHANSNNFTGTISPKIANLRYLYELDISNNNFFGPFPIAILAMNSLSFLDIRYNSFTGAVPLKLFTQTLDVLFINNNFIKKLPHNLGSTPALYLTFANNKFTGPIPKSIGSASSTLIEVLFLNNLITGCVPYQLGLLRNATVIDAGNNLLTGPLPSSLGCLDRIEQLNFASNFLYGKVPEVVCKLGNLVNLSLSNNFFTAVGRVCRKLIKKGVLDLKKNCVRDLANQRSVEDCALFFSQRRNCRNPKTFTLMPCKAPSKPKKGLVSDENYG